MPRVVVDVMPKPEILDPQGKAVLGALPRLGFGGVTDVRQGKRFELQIEGEITEALLEDVSGMAATLLSQPGDRVLRGHRRRRRGGPRRQVVG